MKSISDLRLEYKIALASILVALICILLPSFQISLSGRAMIGAPIPNIRLNLSLLDLGKGYINVPIVGGVSLSDIRSLGADVPSALYAVQFFSIILILGIFASAAVVYLHAIKKRDARIERAYALAVLAISAILSSAFVVVIGLSAQRIINEAGASGDVLFSVQMGAILLPLSLAVSAFFIYKSRDAIAPPAARPIVLDDLVRPICDRPSAPAPLVHCKDCGMPLAEGHACVRPRSAPILRKCATCGAEIAEGEVHDCIWHTVEL